MGVSFQIEMWAAMTPGIERQEDWKNWLTDPKPLDEPQGQITLKQIPPLLRRRFNTLGRCAVGAALKLMKEGDSMPSIFASRHGDTVLTLSLLEEMGRDFPMSPTSFSLAVHNAISGLYSIARNDTSAVTAIASMEGLVIHALLEAVGQLQNAHKVLCVIYDVPLPDLYRRYTPSVPFPYAIAMVLNRTHGESYTLEQCVGSVEAHESFKTSDVESLRFLELLTGLSDEVTMESNGMLWSVKNARV